MSLQSVVPIVMAVCLVSFVLIAAGAALLLFRAVRLVVRQRFRGWLARRNNGHTLPHRSISPVDPIAPDMLSRRIPATDRRYTSARHRTFATKYRRIPNHR